MLKGLLAIGGTGAAAAMVTIPVLVLVVAALQRAGLWPADEIGSAMVGGVLGILLAMPGVVAIAIVAGKAVFWD